MLIDIVSDTVCPWCYIGKRRLERALQQRPGLTVDIGWRPFQLNPEMPAGGMSREEYMSRKFGGPARAERVYQAIVEAGRQEGIDFAFDRIRWTPNTLSSHRLIRWAASTGCQHQVVELLFRAYFLEGQDVGDPAVLAAVAGAAGMDSTIVAKLLAGDADTEVVQSEDQLARDMGISGVPCFIIDRKYAISGAQDPAIFLQVFDLAARDAEAGADVTMPASGW